MKTAAFSKPRRGSIQLATLAPDQCIMARLQHTEKLVQPPPSWGMVIGMDRVGPVCRQHTDGHATATATTYGTSAPFHYSKLRKTKPNSNGDYC